MAQTTYDRDYSTPFSGSPGNTGLKDDVSALNDEGSDIPAGIGVTQKSEGKIEEFDAAADVLAGITLNTFAREPGELSGADDAIKAGAMCNVREKGAVYVKVEETVAVNDPVFCRHTSDGAGNTQLGRFRKDSDAGRARLVRGARWLTGGTTSLPAMLHFDASAEKAAQANAQASRKLVLTAAAEAANAIVVSGVIQDQDGTPVAAAKQVMFRSLAVTADKGDLSVTAGTSKKIVNPATGENVAWLESTAAGAFALSVANDVAEETVVSAITEDGLTAMLKLTFA